MNNLQLEAKFSNIEKINPLFSRCDIAVLATNLNRNNSFISKDTVNKAIPSLFNIPIVAEYIKEKDNFGGHGGKIEIKDNEINFIQTTSPIGVVPESANVYWDNLPDENGNLQEYLIAEGCYLWSGRYEEANKIVGQKFGQSMEISINNSDWMEFEGKKVLDITDFTFSALCVLGISTEEDPNGHVEPCFPSASIIGYSLDKDRFKSEFNQLLAELKFTLQKELNQHGLEGGKKMEENKELVLEEKQFDAEPPEDDDEGAEVEVEIEVDSDPDDEDQEDVAENNEEMMVKADPEPDGDENGEDTDGDDDGKDEKYELLESELSQLKESYSLLESEVKELREFKAQKLNEEKEVEIKTVFESISTKLSDEELAPFKEKAFEMEIADLKKELFALIGQKEFEKQSKFSVSKPMSISILGDAPNETKIEASYASIIKKYNNK